MKLNKFMISSIALLFCLCTCFLSINKIEASSNSIENLQLSDYEYKVEGTAIKVEKYVGNGSNVTEIMASFQNNKKI